MVPPAFSAPVAMATHGGLAGERREWALWGGWGFRDQLGSLRGWGLGSGHQAEQAPPHPGPPEQLPVPC